MEIHVINPTITRHWEESTRDNYARTARADTVIRVHTLDWGTASIESHRDAALAVPGILTKAAQAEQEGADAIIIDCMGDPGLQAARDILSIPVVGPAQACMHLAAMLGHRFSVLALSLEDASAAEDLAACYGLQGKLASARPFGVRVLDLYEDTDATLKALVDTAERAVRGDGAHVLIPGCTELAGLASRIQGGLAECNCEVPVLDPPSVALKLAESLVDLGLAHSPRTYQPPPATEIRWPWDGVAGA
jgi:allantoin racemase